MAEVRVIKRGKYWQYIFEIARIDGRRKRLSKSGFATKKAALEAGIAAKAEYDSSGYTIRPKEISLHDYFDLWLKEYCEINLKPTTTESYRKKIRLYIDPYLGNYKLSSITPIILQTYINQKFNEGFSRNTLSNIKGILNKSLKYAVTPLHFIKTNPMNDVTLPLPNAKPKVPTRKKTRGVITREEFQRIIERFPADTSQHIPLMLGYRCGLRLGEVFALDILKDFDEENKELHVNFQVQNNTSNIWYLADPKFNSHRTIDLDDITFQLLKNKKAQIEKDKAYFDSAYIHLYLTENMEITSEYKERCTEFNPVCRYANGGYVQPRVMHHCGRIVHYKLNMPSWDFHSLRHTHTSMLLSAGANPKYVQQRLGHKNIETTLNIYTHVTEEMKERNIDYLNNCF